MSKLSRSINRVVGGAVAAVLVAGGCIASAQTAVADETPNTLLEGRAQLSATYWAEGPESGKDSKPNNGMTPPYPGQVIPGFSGMVELSDGEFLALPDNGFGAKANSSDYLLRIYQVKPNWETANTAANPEGVGGVEAQKYISLRDPNNVIEWDIVNEGTADRLLTGSDFDPESIVLDKDGSFWIGEEFGPYILHFSADGVLLDAPFAYPGIKSPSNPTLGDEKPTIRNSKGFEAMAGDGKYLYPIFEGYVDAATDKRVRIVSEFDTKKGAYTGRTWDYLVDAEDDLAADSFITKDGTMLVLERDDFWGPEAINRKVYAVDFKKAKPGTSLEKTLMADLLHINNPDRIGMVSDKGAYGVEEDFSFPFQSVETIVELSDGRYLTAVDNNFPGNDARYPGKPDNTEMIIFSIQGDDKGKPAKPAEPAKPGKPGEPATPAKPAEPAKPAKPGKPGLPKTGN